MKTKIFVGVCLSIVGLFFVLYFAGIAALLSGCTSTRDGAKLPPPIPIELERAPK